MPEGVDYPGQIRRLKRRVAALQADAEWLKKEADITHEWGKRAWDEVYALRALLEKAITNGEAEWERRRKLIDGPSS